MVAGEAIRSLAGLARAGAERPAPDAVAAKGAVPPIGHVRDRAAGILEARLRDRAERAAADLPAPLGRPAEVSG